MVKNWKKGPILKVSYLEYFVQRSNWKKGPILLFNKYLYVKVNVFP